MKTTTNTLSRRQLLKFVSIGAGGALLAACVPQGQAPAAPAAPAAAAPKATEAAKPAEAMKAMVNSVGRELPADAAPPEQQVYLGDGEGKGGTFLDISANVYNRGPFADLYGVPLTRTNKDFENVPGAAKTWKVDDKGTTWTFVLRDDIKWTDDTPLTADDFVATFRYMADPDAAYDFTWYYSKGAGNIKNFDEVVGKKAKLEDLGVRKGANEFELLIETSEPTPYLPRLFGFAMPLHAKSLLKPVDPSKKYNAAYNADPKTCVSCGPFIVKEYTPTRVEVVANPKAAPDIRPFLERCVAVKHPNAFQAYQAGQVDTYTPANAAEIDTVLNDPVLSKEALPDVGDFRTDYFFFDPRTPPFDNKKFRQALAHLVDRDSIVKVVVKPVFGRAAYSFLAPGFPAANGEELKKYANYDPDMAKKLFAESGVDAKAIGKLTIFNRTANDSVRAGMCQVFADAIKQTLGIEVDVQSIDNKDYMAELLKKDADNKPTTSYSFGRIDYGMDYLDPSNMLSVLKGSDLGGRHTWNNKEFQDLLAKAGPLTNEEERTKMYQKAEEILVEDAAFIFIVHRTPLNLWKPYIKGTPMLPGKVNTNPGLSWPGFAMISTHPTELYIGAEAAQFRTNIP